MINFTYFGSSRLSVIVLDELLKLNFKPRLIVTTKDKPQGRKLEVKPNIVKSWAIEHNIPVIDDLKNIPKEGNELFIVASYGKIIPNEIIELPKYKTLNIHPSLLPRYRGASPLPTAILEDTKKTGVTIMQLDSEMDHGSIVAQREISLTDHFKDWPTYEVFEEFMAKEGAKLLAEIMPDWVAEKIIPKEQDHSKAIYTKKIVKEDGLVDLNSNDPYLTFRKIQAYHEWPVAYFFIERDGKQIRVKITEAEFEKAKGDETRSLIIKKVIPEGKKEMSFQSFKQGYLK